jgi:hypothetical protein
VFKVEYGSDIDTGTRVFHVPALSLSFSSLSLSLSLPLSLRVSFSPLARCFHPHNAYRWSFFCFPTTSSHQWQWFPFKGCRRPHSGAKALCRAPVEPEQPARRAGLRTAVHWWLHHRYHHTLDVHWNDVLVLLLVMWGTQAWLACRTGFLIF